MARLHQHTQVTVSLLLLKQLPRTQALAKHDPHQRHAHLEDVRMATSILSVWVSRLG